MCLIVFAWKIAPGAPLIAAGNRDEYYERPAAPATEWPDCPRIYAGRDLRGGGSWMGIARAADGGTRFAALTNIRAPGERREDAPTRGALVADFLKSELSPEDYVAAIASDSAAYNGFNLIVGKGDSLVWFSNRGQDDPRNGKPLAPGIYGLSNALLDAPWPKVLKTKAQFASLLCLGAPPDAYFEMLSDTARAPDSRLPDTGIPLPLERALSAVCIETPDYGTRASTVVTLYHDAPGELRELIIR
jgi:uncharacterized protein with NRDE domain